MTSTSRRARQDTDEFGKSLYGTADVGIIAEVAAIAADHGVSRAQVALAWVSHNPTVSAPIVGATKPHHLDDAIASVDLVLSDDEVARLEAPYTPQPTRGFI